VRGTLLDDELFGALNRPESVWAQALLSASTNTVLLFALGAAAAVYVGLRTPGRWMAAAALIVSVVLADQIALRVLDPAFERPRPCSTERGAAAPLGCPAGYSLPSRQAAAAAAGATVFAAAAPLLSGVAVATALLTGAARVYAGDAWPTDVVAGFVLGAAVAAGVLSVTRLRFLQQSSRRY
jgi:undecaprenyl-diphosphatase